MACLPRKGSCTFLGCPYSDAFNLRGTVRGSPRGTRRPRKARAGARRKSGAGISSALSQLRIMQQQPTENEAPAISPTSSPTAVLLKQAVGICGSVLGNIQNARMEKTEDVVKLAALFDVAKSASQVVMNLRQARTTPNIVLQPPTGGLSAPQIFGGQSSLMPSPSQPFGNPGASLVPQTNTRPPAVSGLSSQRLFGEEPFLFVADSSRSQASGGGSGVKRKRGAANKTDASLAGAQVPWPTAHRAWCRGDAPAALRLGPADAPGQHTLAGALRTAQTPAAWRGVPRGSECYGCYGAGGIARGAVRCLCGYARARGCVSWGVRVMAPLPECTAANPARRRATEQGACLF